MSPSLPAAAIQRYPISPQASLPFLYLALHLSQAKIAISGLQKHKDCDIMEKTIEAFPSGTIKEKKEDFRV